MTIEEILAKNKAKSEDPDNAGYSPLQCAIYEGELNEARELVTYYRKNGTLAQELAFVSPAAMTRENILQVAMKHPAILDLCCKAIAEVDPALFSTIVEHTDVDEDSIFHQVVEFGRAASLVILMPYLEKHVVILLHIHSKMHSLKK